MKPLVILPTYRWRNANTNNHFKWAIREVVLRFLDKEHGPLKLPPGRELWRENTHAQPLPPSRMPPKLLVPFVKVRDDWQGPTETLAQQAAFFIPEWAILDLEVEYRIIDAQSENNFELDDDQKHAFRALWKAGAHKQAYDFAKMMRKLG